VSDQFIKILVAGALLVHGLGHTGAIGALLFINLSHSTNNGTGTNTGGWLPARSWLLPSLGSPTATTVASIFWVLSTIGFVTAAMSFWGFLVPTDAWRQIAIVSSFISILGIALFFGTWPAFNTVAALAVNVAVLVTQLWLYWPPQEMFGR